MTRRRSTLAYALIVLLLLVGAWLLIRQNGWEAHAREWLNLLVRWTHVVIGIAWIGTSFYFIFLENSLNRTKDLREELAGNLWAVHGGGFYYVEKYKVAPQKLPEKLHWFKWEAYLTWITGVALLGIVYYANANLYLIDPAVLDISPSLAVGIGIGVLALAWIVYDRLCRSPLVRRGMLFSLTGFLLTTVAAFFLTQVFSGRAAYVHVGAMLGTLMAGNVFFVIIPSQKALVKAAEERRPLDPKLGQHAGLRSLHNNYLTLPVIFVMISNHFPMTYGHGWNWAVLAGLFLASVGIRHYLNLQEKGRNAAWLLPVATLAILALAYVTAPLAKEAEAATGTAERVTFQEVAVVIEQRCTTCHAAAPSDDVFTSAPAGVMFDTPEQIKTLASRIMDRAVLTQTMPLGNKTNISPEERELLRRWISEGAMLE
jgi:uncharacterized membrane protein